MTEHPPQSSRRQTADELPLTYRFNPTLSPGMTRLGLNEITTFRWTLPQDVAACHDFGIQNLGIWWPKLIRFGEERGIELIRDSGLHVSSLSYAGGFTGSFGLRFKEAVAETKDALRLAQQLRANCITLLSGGKERYTAKHAARLFRSGLKRILETAEECQVAAAIKPTHPSIQRKWSFLTSLDAALEEIAHFQNPHLKLAIDVSQIEDHAQFLGRVHELTPHIALVKLSDAHYPLDGQCNQYDRRQLGQGTVPLLEIVQSLEAAGYRGCYEIALWSRSLWETSYANVLKEAITRFDTFCRR